MRGTIYLCGIVVVLSSVLSLEARVVSSANNVFDTLWPFPQAATAEGEVPLLISEETLKFVPDVPDALSSRVDRLSSRYRDIILNTTCSPKKPGARDQPEHTVEPYVMPPVHLTVASDTMPLGPGTDESYTLSLSPENASISARTYTGLVHGLEIFSQLMICIPAGPPTKIFGDALVINATRISIEDFPRFTHRAIMIDTARHFLPVTHILKVLDAMSYAHFSVLHWHITDAQSFPLVLSSLPNLTRGAYTAQDVYTTADVHAIVTHAFDRGIRVIPEIDQPGHAASWEAGYPGLTVPECGTLNPAYPGLYCIALCKSRLSERRCRTHRCFPAPTWCQKRLFMVGSVRMKCLCLLPHILARVSRGFFTSIGYPWDANALQVCLYSIAVLDTSRMKKTRMRDMLSNSRTLVL
eukprot:m.759437 g.759437  ORF g.759437 m.759437 type:complete len:411 (+) comp23196_c1_seq6:107-1339(+)